MACRHEIPTHLAVEDRVVLGLTMRQVMLVLLGSTCSYAVWEQWPEAMVGLRLVLPAVGLLLTLGLVFLHPAGRPMEDWLVVLLRFAVLPKQRVWRPSTSETTVPRETAGWVGYTPQVTWKGEVPHG